MKKELTKHHQHHQQKFDDIKCLALLTSTTSFATISYRTNSILYDLFKDSSRKQMIYAIIGVMIYAIIGVHFPHPLMLIVHDGALRAPVYH